MFRFLAPLAMLFTVLLTTPLNAQYTTVCQNGVCRLVPSRMAASPQVQARLIQVTAQPTGYVAFQPQPITQASFSREISLVQPLDNSVVGSAVFGNSSTYNQTLVGSPVLGNCGCATTGICSCPPGTCACVGCTCAAMGLQAAPVQYATGYYSAAPMVTYSSFVTAPMEKIIQTPTGHVHVSSDGWGNVSTAHSGGYVQRRVARQERWRARHGVQ